MITKEIIQSETEEFIEDYCRRNNISRIWQTPLIRYADAFHPEIRALQTIVIENHRMPEEILSDPTVILAYYLPFIPGVAKSNIGGGLASECWAKAYQETYKLSKELNNRLIQLITDAGHRAAFPADASSFDENVLKSRWSHRHIAKVAGLGTFGINQMLITENGCCGRYYTIVTDLPFEANAPLQEENCLYKSKEKCGVCVKHCFSGALTTERFDRHKCYETTLRNAAIYDGSEICGKCVVGLPCSFKKP
ncbi:epoxyqueuosine reductase [Methanimicrococcus blatticola]|uniref:Epoxyqueuosine reductase QueG n=1 Tax=Methanimicrococcus blatticola TaxID=91560 RepID=A0A484F5Z0_9EURY|nr:epoxyqueuosine reductase [Methanimicrococcus blatticola]MBZ3935014.1 hypothetical protein [Methanimicrococcus blatticola]MCC2508888.1 hypothetical protein [Methanimicrococcus blatticola]TDQ71084.1 epoxyqueuosine reductase QueG [Methanimicrococcus blatticola]